MTKKELYRPGLGLSIVRSGTCRALQSRRLVWRAYATTCASRSSRVTRTFRGRRIEYRLQPDGLDHQAYPAEAGTLYAVPYRQESHPSQLTQSVYAIFHMAYWLPITFIS